MSLDKCREKVDHLYKKSMNVFSTLYVMDLSDRRDTILFRVYYVLSTNVFREPTV